MRSKRNQVRNIVLFEGHVRWIMERETPEERLAAWETLAAIAFPNAYELPYKPPELPVDGRMLSPCDRARRDTYNMLSDFITSRVWEQSGRIKDNKKSEAGKKGAAIRYGMSDSSDSESCEGEESCLEGTHMTCVGKPFGVQAAPQIPINMAPRETYAEETDYFSNGFKKKTKGLTEEDRKKIAEWHRKFPDAESIRRWAERNYFYQNRTVVCSTEFCQFAYSRLALEENWVSYKTGHAMNSIRNAIHWMAIEYMRKSSEIKRTEEEEHRKDLESEFETKSLVASQMSNEDVSALERKRRRQAEREAMELIMKGEL